MNWEAFASEAPELASLGRERFERAELVMLGTIRRDGSPRISPVEPDFCDGELYLGMIWHSYKALDVLRDSRCTVHSVVADRLGTGGEFKLHGRAIDIHDLDARRRYGDVLYERIGWRPDEPNWHLFSIDIDSAAFLIVDGDERAITRWRAGQPIESFRAGP